MFEFNSKEYQEIVNKKRYARCSSLLDSWLSGRYMNKYIKPFKYCIENMEFWCYELNDIRYVVGGTDEELRAFVPRDIYDYLKDF